MLAYFRLREGVFASPGYAVGVDPRRLKDCRALFITLDAVTAKPTGTSKVLGSSATSEDDYFVHLQPWRGLEPDKVNALIEHGCMRLEDALDGDAKALKVVGEVVQSLVVSELKHAAPAAQIGLLAALFGRGRVLDELNRRGCVDALFKLDLGKMTREALSG